MVQLYHGLRIKCNLFLPLFEHLDLFISLIIKPIVHNQKNLCTIFVLVPNFNLELLNMNHSYFFNRGCPILFLPDVSRVQSYMQENLGTLSVSILSFSNKSPFKYEPSIFFNRGCPVLFLSNVSRVQSYMHENLGALSASILSSSNKS
jgi:hypothetical protein